MRQLGKFREGFASHRRILAGVSVEKRLLVFQNVVREAASYASHGLDRITIIDELADIAVAHGMPTDTAQSVIAEAFAALDRPATYTPLPNKPQPSLPIQSKADFLRAFIPPRYLIDGILQRKFVYALTGQTGHAKTAIALLLAQLVGQEAEAKLGHKEVEHGRVVYFVGENPDDIRMRIIGSDSVRNSADSSAANDRITFIPGIFSIQKMAGTISAHATQIGGVDLVIVDTSAAYFPGNDEISNTEMGRYARLLRQLTALPGGPCVLVLCHPVKNPADGAPLLPRGGGAFLAEMDGNLTVAKRDEHTIELHHDKIRGPGFEALTFRLETIRTEALKDDRGRLIPTVRAVTMTANDEKAETARARDDEDRVLVALLGDPEATYREMAERWGWATDDGLPHKSRVEKALKRMDQSARPKLLRENRGTWELTEEGRTVARKAALRFEPIPEPL